MKIRIERGSDDETLLEGNYSYLEGGYTQGNPSFHISVQGPKDEYEIHFNFEDRDELKSLIGSLQEVLEND